MHRLNTQNTLSTSVRPSLSTRIVSIAGALMIFSLVGLGLLLINNDELEETENDSSGFNEFIQESAKKNEPDTIQAQNIKQIILFNE